MNSWIETLLGGPIEPAPCQTLAQWWPRHHALCRQWPGTIGQAIVCGFHADRLGWAFASAYHAALRALLPDLPADRLVALCITEAEGNSPRAIKSELRREAGGYVLSGAKRWTTLGQGVPLLLVAARDAQVQSERPVLRLARVPADAAGVHIEPMAATPFIPEVPHAQLRFDNVHLPDDALLPGDGYLRYIKPFRTTEDAHVQLALLAYLVREARRLSWPPAWVERAISALLSLSVIATHEPLASSTHIALAGAMATVDALVVEADACWKLSPDDPAAARWIRDRALLTVASTQRRKRTARAWERMGAVS